MCFPGATIIILLAPPLVLVLILLLHRLLQLIVGRQASRGYLPFVNTLKDVYSRRGPCTVRGFAGEFATTCDDDGYGVNGGRCWMTRLHRECECIFRLELLRNNSGWKWKSILCVCFLEGWRIRLKMVSGWSGFMPYLSCSADNICPDFNRPKKKRPTTSSFNINADPMEHKTSSCAYLGK